MNRKIGVILSYVQMIFEVLSTLLLTPFIISTLGQAEFGVYKLSAAITAYLLLLDLGVGNAIIRYISKYRIEQNRVKERQFFGIATLFYLGISIISFFLGCILVYLFPTIFSTGLTQNEIILGQKLLFITLITVSFSLATMCYNNILIAYENFKVSRLCTIIQIILKIIMSYISLRLGYGSIGIVSVNLFLTILMRLYMMFYVFVKMKLYPIFKNLDRKFVKEIVLYSSLIFIQMIATQLNSTVDQLLLGSFVKSSAVIIGIYGIGTQVVQYFQSIGSAFTSVLMPGIVSMVENNADAKLLNKEMVRIGRIIFMILILIWGCFLVNGNNFIVLWAGKENELAYYVALILMFAYIFVLSESIGTQILWALNEHKEQSYLKMFIVLINILLTIILIKWNPLFGATIGTFLSLILGDVGVMNYIFAKKLKIDLKYYYFNLLKGILPSIVLTVTIGFLMNQVFSITWIGLILKVSSMCVIYAICMLVFGMNKYEKSLVKSVLRIK